MIDVVLNILSFGIKPMVEYNNIIKEFRNKLPREQNQAKTLTEDEVVKNPILKDLSQIHSIVITSTHKISLSESDIDLFYNKLDNFDDRLLLFKNYYRSYTRNLKRFKPEAESGNFDLVWVQKILRVDRKNHPLEPFDVFVYHLKWKIPITSTIYQFFLKKN